MGDILKSEFDKKENEKISFFKEKGAEAYFKKYGRYLPNGWEVGDPTPMAIPLGCRKPLTLQEQLARLSPMAMFNLSRQWSDGDEEENDLLDPEDPEDYSMLEEIARKEAEMASTGVSQVGGATSLPETVPSVAQERNSEVPDGSKE